jgi:hypothetical protein
MLVELLQTCSPETQEDAFDMLREDLLTRDVRVYCAAQGLAVGWALTDAFLYPDGTLHWHFQAGDAPVLVPLAIAIGGVRNQWAVDLVAHHVDRGGKGGGVLRNRAWQLRIEVLISSPRLAADLAQLVGWSPRTKTFSSETAAALRCDTRPRGNAQ